MAAIVRPLRKASVRFEGSGGCECPCGGTGRRARLKIEFRKECWFDSGQGHQLGCSSRFESVRNRSHGDQKPLKNRLFPVHRFSLTFVLTDPSRPICWYFCWYRENKRSRRLS